MVTTIEEFGKRIKVFAQSLDAEPLGLVDHAPEPWAKVNMCFANAERKACILPRPPYRFRIRALLVTCLF
jgi:hypothetical protein